MTDPARPVLDRAVESVVEIVEHLAGLVVGVGADVDPGPLTTDCLKVAYRLHFAASAARAGALLTPADAVASLSLDVVPTELLTAELLDDLAARLGDLDSPRDLGAVHEQLLTRAAVVVDGRLRLPPPAGAATGRKATGSFYTPPALVEWILDHALEPSLPVGDAPASFRVLDPSCGAGVFLVHAARRLRRHGLSVHEAVRAVVGVDRDAGAVELARIALWWELLEPGHRVEMPELALRTDDALLGTDWHALVPGDGFDAVLGNPPFLNQLERLSAHGAGVAARLDELSEGVLRPYTDVSAVFLQRAAGWVRPGGRIGLVQPQSLLAARDAAGVRAYLARTCALEALWASDTPVFDAHVLTCAPVLRRASAQAPVRRFHGPAFEEVAPRRDPELGAGWAYLLAAGLGIPEVELDPVAGVLSDLAECTADFRDEYYGLAPYVHEAKDVEGRRAAPLVTSGLIDPARCWWGERQTRFLKQRWDAPVIDLEDLGQDEALSAWARKRLVPKVLVGTQGKVVEAVVDEDGGWLPSVPTITVAPDRDLLWHVLAVLLAPPVAAHAAATFAGTALSMRAIKLSARQVGQLPLPRHREGWDLAAEAVRLAQHDPTRRREHLIDAAGHMCAAYGVGDETLDWWVARF